MEKEPEKIALQPLFNEIAYLKAALEAERRLSAALRRDLMRAEGVKPPTYTEDMPEWLAGKQKPGR